MGAEQIRNVSIRKQDLKNKFGLVRCGNPECAQVFGENSQAYWNYAPRKLICSSCENEVVFHGADFASSDMSEIAYIYRCDFCKEEYYLKIPMDRKYCSVCKIEWYRSRTFHLRAPLPPQGHPNSGVTIILNKNVA